MFLYYYKTKKNQSKKAKKTLKHRYPKIFNINRSNSIKRNALNISLQPINLPKDFSYYIEDIRNIAKLWNSNKLFKKRLTYNSNPSSQDMIKKTDLWKFTSIKKEEDFSIDSNKIPMMKDFVDKSNSLIKDKESRRFLDDMMTEFNTLYFLDNMVSRMRFIYFIVETFQNFFTIIYQIDSKYNETNLNIMFKGGTIIRFIIMEYLRGFTKEIEDFIINDIKHNIKLSDYDFEIMTQLNIDENDIIQLNNLIYLVSIRIRNYLYKNRYTFFDFFRYSSKTQQQMIKELKLKMQQVIDKKSPSMDNNCLFKDIKIDYIDFDGCYHDINIDKPNKHNKKYKTLTNSILSNNNFCRKDYGIIINSKDEIDSNINLINGLDLLNLYKIPKEIIKILYPYKPLNNNEIGRNVYSRFITTHNPLVENKEAGISFQLNRIKYIYNIYFRKEITINNITKTLYLRHPILGEILDLSHAYNDDRKKPKFRQFNRNSNFKQYDFLNYDLSFMSYSIEGLILDLDSIIFTETKNKPWLDLKYHKRLKRLIYLYLFYFFSNQIKLSDQEKLTDLETLIKLVKNDGTIKTDFITKDKLFLRLVQLLLDTSKHKLQKEYKEYKETTLELLENINMVFKAQKSSTKEFNMGIGYLSNTILTIDFPSIY